MISRESCTYKIRLQHSVNQFRVYAATQSPSLPAVASLAPHFHIPASRLQLPECNSNEAFSHAAKQFVTVDT